MFNCVAVYFLCAVHCYLLGMRLIPRKAYMLALSKVNFVQNQTKYTRQKKEKKKSDLIWDIFGKTVNA